MSPTTGRGGKREGSGRKRLEGGITRRLFSLTPIHDEILEQYRVHHQLRSSSAALRHLIENAAKNIAQDGTQQ
jgi:hypothetical protein